MNTITIDCGASFIKGALFCDGEIMKRRNCHAPSAAKRRDGLEPVQINRLLPLVDVLLGELADGLAEARLCISNEMHGFLLSDRDGNALTDYISWQQEFGGIPVGGTTAVRELSAECLRGHVVHSGMPLRAGLPSTNLCHLSLSGWLGKQTDSLYFYTLGDYILRKLSGRQPACHPTNAAATGLYDIVAGTWNGTLIDSAGAGSIVFPEIGERPTDFDYRGTRITALPAIGDQQAALLGAGITNGSLSFNLGTGAQVSKLTDAPRFGANYQIRPFFGGTYLKTVPHIPSGRALNVFIRFVQSVFDSFSLEISEEKIWEVLLGLAGGGMDTGLICDLSFFENAVTGATRGYISNIGEYELTLPNVFNAVLEQLSDNFVTVADAVEPNINNIKNIVFSGGVALRIPFIREQILKHYRYGIPASVVSDETMLGLYRYYSLCHVL